MMPTIIKEIVTSPDFLAASKIDPQKAQSIAKQYFKGCIKAMIQQFYTADLHSQLILTQGIPETIKNRQKYIDDPTRTAKRLDFLYPDDVTGQNFVLYDDRTIEQGIDRQRVYETLKQEHGLSGVIPKSFSDTAFKNWIDRAVKEAVSVHQQRLNHEVDIQIKDGCFATPEIMNELAGLPDDTASRTVCAPPPVLADARASSYPADA